MMDFNEEEIWNKLTQDLCQPTDAAGTAGPAGPAGTADPAGPPCKLHTHKFATRSPSAA